MQQYSTDGKYSAKNSSKQSNATSKAYNLIKKTNSSLLKNDENYIETRINSVSPYLEELQNKINSEIILEIWENFRECENKKEGRIPKREFKNGVTEILFEKYGELFPWQQSVKDIILDLIFDRFNYENNKTIDIYDFLISMAILSRANKDKKISLILKLVDVDEDRCLSIGEVFKMILAIEKNFVKEMNTLNFQSGILYNEIAFKNALKKFRLVICDKHPVEIMTQKYITQTLITYKEFFRILQKNKTTYKNFLPTSQRMTHFLKTRFNEMLLECPSQEYMRGLLSFIKEIHEDLRPSPEFNLYISKPPGEVIITDGNYGKKDDDQNSNTITSEANLKHQGLHKIKNKSKRSLFGTEGEGNKNEKLLLDSLQKIRKFRANLDDKEFIENFKTNNNKKKRKKYDEDSDDENNPQKFVETLMNKTKEQRKRLNAMENDKNMDIEFPNAMPNTKMLTEALDIINESSKVSNMYKNDDDFF